MRESGESRLNSTASPGTRRPNPINPARERHQARRPGTGEEKRVTPHDHPDRTDREHPEAPPADRGGRGEGRRGPGAGPALRGGDPGHHRAVRGHGLAGDHRRRAEEVPQLLDVLRARAAEHGPGRLQDPVLGRPHPPDAAAHGRAVPLQAVRRQLPGRGPAVRPRAGEAGGHLALGPEPHVPGRRDPRLPPRAVHRRPAARARDRGPQLPAEGRAQGPDRLHRGAAGGQDRPLRATSSTASST